MMKKLRKGKTYLINPQQIVGRVVLLDRQMPKKIITKSDNSSKWNGKQMHEEVEARRFARRGRQGKGETRAEY